MPLSDNEEINEVALGLPKIASDSELKEFYNGPFREFLIAGFKLKLKHIDRSSMNDKIKFIFQKIVSIQEPDGEDLVPDVES